MKKSVTTILACFVLFTLVFSITVLAEKGGASASSSKGSSSANSGATAGAGEEQEIKVKVENRGESGNIRSRIESEGVSAESDVEIETEEGETGVSVKAKLSNGNKQEIKIMPNTASEKAIEVLGSKNLTIQLKEVGKPGETELVYEAEANKTARILGIFKTKIKIQAQISAENGTILKYKKPWWSFLVSGEEDVQLGDKVTICHVPPGNPENKHTIIIGSPAVKAHLKHGDYLGECEGEEPGNETNQTNQTTENFLDILSPENTTYTTNDVLVNLSSNSNTILFSINNNANQTYTASIIKTFENGSNTLTAFALFTTQVNETITTINETTNETITTINTTTATEMLIKSVVFTIEPASPIINCSQQGETCGGIAELICCESLGCNYSENMGMPNASGICIAQLNVSIPENETQRNQSVELNTSA